MKRVIRIGALVVGLTLAWLGVAYAEGDGPRLTEGLLRDADANRDGQVTFEELKALLPLVTEDMFHHFDHNGDGVLSPADLPDPPTDPVAILRHLLESADANHDGKVGFPEAKAFMPLLTEDMFHRLDRNGDHFLSPADLPQPPDVDPLELLKHLLHNADTNGDGGVTLEEARTLIPEFREDRFAFLDRNGDGVLSREDLPAPPPDDPIRRLIALLREADADHNGEITYDEVLAILPGFPEEAFQVLDQNDDGVLTLEDLPDNPHAFEQLLEILKQADTNEDHKVSLEELQALIPQVTQEQFDRLDRNDDGFLSRADLPGPPCEHPFLRLLHLLREADADHNGEVTLEELQAVIPTFTEHAFSYLDRNDDGVISEADLPDGPPPGPEEMLLHLLRAADANEDGEVTFEELKALLPELTQDRFDRLDKNHDGVLSRDDLPPFPHDFIEHIIRILRDADENGDQQVTFDELHAVMPELTQEQFNRLDRNDDGVITPADLPEPPHDLLHRALEMLHRADADDNHEVTFDELKAVMPELTHELFDRLDRNDDGVITKEDLPDRPEDPRDRIRRILHEADANGNHEVTFEELQAVKPDITQERFDQLDRNGDGVISAADLPDGPIPPDDHSRLEMLRQLYRADLNDDGVLDFSEIAQAFPHAPSELLARIDTNHDWVITRAELRAALEAAHDGGEITSDADVDADGSANAVDVQATVNSVLGIEGDILKPDVDGDDNVDAVDVQSVVNGVLGIN